jgi:hypothetical protein
VSARGQALVELAVCMPVVVLLGLGAAGAVEVADAASGLRAATEAALATAVRQPSAPQAQAAAAQRFRAVVASYPLRNVAIVLAAGGFGRGSTISATASGDVDLGWEAMSFLPASVHLTALASREVEPWRSRG